MLRLLRPPRSQQLLLVRLKNTLYFPKFMIGKTTAICQFNWIEPKLRIPRLASHVDMRRLLNVSLVKADSESANPQDGRHASQYIRAYII